MTKITTPVPIVEFGSTHVRLAIYDKFILNQNFSYEKKIDFTKNNIDLDGINSSNLDELFFNYGSDKANIFKNNALNKIKL